MKYYKNLIKRKKYKVLIISLLTLLLGLSLCYFAFKDVTITTNGFGYSNTYKPYSILINIINSTNLGMLFIGFMVLYFAFICTTWNPYAQDDTDYIIKSVDDNIYIKYKKYEFLVKKETFSPDKLCFKDKNKKFVTTTVAYRIYNYVEANGKDYLEQSINDSNSITRYDVINKFSDVRKTMIDDKKAFLNTHKIYNKNVTIYLITTIILGFWLVLISLALIGGLGSVLLDKNDKDIFTVIIALILFVPSLFLMKLSIKAMKKNKTIYSQVMNNDLYIINCKIFDKKNEEVGCYDGGSETHYYIKITDENYVVDEWIEVSEEIYNQNTITLYALDKFEKDVFMLQ